MSAPEDPPDIIARAQWVLDNYRTYPIVAPRKGRKVVGSGAILIPRSIVQVLVDELTQRRAEVTQLHEKMRYMEPKSYRIDPPNYPD